MPVLKKTDKQLKLEENFMQWVGQEIKDDYNFRRLILQVLWEAQTFLLADLRRSRRLIKAKMLLARQKYPSPEYTLLDAQKEREYEMVDLIGWTYVKMWNKIRIDNEKRIRTKGT
jgi:hypothetical protein